VKSRPSNPSLAGSLASRGSALSTDIAPSTILHVKVVPGSSRDRIAGRYADGIKVQTSAAPEKGKANAAVAEILAQFFGIKPSQVELVSAPANPRKQFRISGLTPAQIAAKLAEIP
jgi:uncharacterized protein (TIGR00251 family)